MRSAIRWLIRNLVMAVLFFLSKARRVRIERWLRGRWESQDLQRADVVIVSFGKSGRTWLRVLLSRFYQAKHGLDERHLIGFDNLNRMNPAIPRIFFTHDNYLKDYTGHAENKQDYYGKKVILLARNPLDTTVSQYFQWKFRMRPAKKALNNYPEHGAETEIFPFTMSPEAGLPKVIEYMNLWASEAPRCHDFLLVRYEDLRADTAGTLQRIVEFIGTPGQKPEIDEAVRFASVENMRQMEQKRTFWLSGNRMVAKDKSNPNSYKVRKAKVGGFRDYFDDAQIAEMQTVVDRDLSPLFAYRPAEKN